MNYPIIGSKLIFVDDNNNVLLVRRGPTAPTRPGDWEPPGGFVESNEEPLQTAIREGSEEVGILANNPVCVYTHTLHNQNYTGFYYYQQLYNRQQVTLSYEHDDYIWLPIEESIKKVTVPLFKFALANTMNYFLISQPFKSKISTKAILVNGAGHLALKRSHTDELGPGLWDLPGGGVEVNETLDRAIKREVREETGLVAIEPKLTFAHTEVLEAKRLIHTRVGFKANVNLREVVLSEEHDEYKWIHKYQMYDFMKHPNWPGWGEFVKLFG